MEPGVIYILSNPLMRKNIHKIGLTTKPFEQRLKRLNGMTTTPGKFDVVARYSLRDVKTAERRIHLLLDEKRIDIRKEFFNVSRKDAISCALAVVAFEEEKTNIDEEFLIKDSIRHATYLPSQRYIEYRLINLMMSATINNAPMDSMFGIQKKVVDGFLSVEQIRAWLNLHDSTIARALHLLRENWREVSAANRDEIVVPKVFDAFYYRNRHVAWRFTKDMRSKFYNLKILKS